MAFENAAVPIAAPQAAFGGTSPPRPNHFEPGPGLCMVAKRAQATRSPVQVAWLATPGIRLRRIKLRCGTCGADEIPEFPR